jgi:hypothetical protein
MRLGRHPTSSLLRYLYRGIAVFFLLFTTVDISSPHLCSEELEGLAASAAQNATIKPTAVDDGMTAILNDDSRPQQPAAPSSSEEDCFCCCSHVLPGLCFSVAVLHFESLEADPQQDCLLTPPLRALYHPPRFV